MRPTRAQCESASNFNPTSAFHINWLTRRSASKPLTDSQVLGKLPRGGHDHLSGLKKLNCGAVDLWARSASVVRRWATRRRRPCHRLSANSPGAFADPRMRFGCEIDQAALTTVTLTRFPSWRNARSIVSALVAWSGFSIRRTSLSATPRSRARPRCETPASRKAP